MQLQLHLGSLKLLDPYVYHGTETLKNKFDIRDPEELSQAEIAFNLVAADEGYPKGKFDSSHLRSIHKHGFKELYDWAGDFRSVDISKGDTTFCRSDYIESELNKLLNKLTNKDHCLTNCADKEAFVTKFADYYCELNVIHPFREGNGRATRAFFQQLAEHNGYAFDLSNVTKEQWIQASIDGFNCDNSRLENILSEALQPMEVHRNIGNSKYLLTDSANGMQLNIHTNSDVLKYFEIYDKNHQIENWIENGKIKTQIDFHYLENENPERVAAVLNTEFKTSVKVTELENIRTPSKIEIEIE